MQEGSVKPPAPFCYETKETDGQILVCNIEGNFSTVIHAQIVRFFLRLLPDISIQGPAWDISGYESIESSSQEQLTLLGAALGQITQTIEREISESHQSKFKFFGECEFLETLKLLLENLESFGSEKNKTFVHNITLEFERNVQPIYSQLPQIAYSLLLSETSIYRRKDDIKFTRVPQPTDNHPRICNLGYLLASIMKLQVQPLPVAKAILTRFHSTCPLSNEEISCLFPLVKISVARLALENAQAMTLLETLQAFDTETVSLLFRNACSHPLAQVNFTNEQIIQARRDHTGKNLKISYQNPLHIVRGFMQYLYDEKGTRYLDGVNNVCHVGHCHPHVVQAAQEQIAKLNTNTRYLHEHLANYSQQLASTFPHPLEVCFFVCSGSEANELAIRLAKTYTDRKNFIVVDHAYHGNTETLVGMSPYKCERTGGKGLSDNVRKIAIPDVYRGIYAGRDNPGQLYADLVDEAIEYFDSRVAAFFAESIMGCGGQVVLPDGYLARVYEKVRSSGGVCIADEVQVGFGRCGSHMWTFETQNVIPDIVTLGKPIGNGHPMGAVITTRAIADAFANGMEYFNTFGGNPVSCAVGLATLRVIQNERLMEHVQVQSKFLFEKLSELKRFEFVGDVRGIGFYLGVDLVVDKQSRKPAKELAVYVIEQLRVRYRILISTDGPFDNVLKIKPPLVFSHCNAKFLVSSLEETFQELAIRFYAVHQDLITGLTAQ